METAFFVFFPLGVINSVKSPQKKNNYSPENETCVYGTGLLQMQTQWNSFQGHCIWTP